MAYPTMNSYPRPDSGIDRSFQPRLNESMFGDGYEQVSPNGINSNLQTLSMKWTNAKKAEGEYISAFLNSRKGQPFLYNLNDEDGIKSYRCTKWNVAKKSGQNFDITAEFKQTASI